LYPEAAEKLFLLREFDETLKPFEKDIGDRWRLLRVYVSCRKQIEQGIAIALTIYGTTRISSAPHAGKPMTVTNFAVGADHGGFELKESLKQYLQQRGLTVA